jgi:hypothetical protein
MTNYTEFYDKKKLMYIIKNYQTIKEELQPEMINCGFNTESIETILRKYMGKSKNYNNKINKVNVEYKQKNKGIGRFYAVGCLSLQNLPREIRQTIAKEYYIDIDIKNCHPVILLHYAKLKELPCKYIEKYCENRDEIFKEINEITGFSNERIKMGFLQLLNGGTTFLKHKDLPKIVKKFNSEVQFIQTYIFNNEKEYRKLGEKNANKKKEEDKFYNLLGSTTNMMLQDIENKLLQCMVDYLTNNNIYKESLVLVFDGIMMYKKDVQELDIYNLLKLLEKEINDKLGYSIKLSIKEMNEDINIPVDELENNEVVNIAMNDADAAKLLIKEINEIIVKCNGIIYYKYNNIWMINIKDIEDELKLKLFNLNIRKYKKATKKDILEGEDIILYNGVEYCVNKYEDFSKNLSDCKNIITSMYSYIRVDNLFVNKIYETTKGKLFFNNGYYDLINNIFIENFDGVYTTKKIDKDFKISYLENNKEKVDEIYKRVLIPVFGQELLEKILLFTARALAGMTNDKNFGLIMGDRDSGKSKYKNLCETAFSSYVGILNMNSLLLDKSGGDQEKKLSWLYDSFDKRLLFGSEIKLDGSKLDGNLLKSVCSSSDKIKMRKNYVDATDFYIQCTLCLICNDLPAIEPMDAIEKMVPFNCGHKFVKEITEEDKIINPHYRLGDSTIDEYVMNEEVGEAFIYIVLNNFKNQPVMLNETQKDFLWNFKVEDEFEKFKAEFEITKNKNYKIKTEDIKSFLFYTKSNISLPKVSLYLVNRGCIHKKAIKIDGKTYNGYEGVRKINSYNHEEEENKKLDI